MHCGLSGRASMDISLRQYTKTGLEDGYVNGSLGVDDFLESCRASTVVVKVFKLRKFTWYYN